MEWKDIKNIRGLRSVATIGSSNIIGTAITSVFWISIAGLLGTESYGELSYFLAIIGISSVIATIGGGSWKAAWRWSATTMQFLLRWGTAGRYRRMLRPGGGYSKITHFGVGVQRGGYRSRF